MKKRRARRSRRGPVIAVVAFALIAVVIFALIAGSSGGSFDAYSVVKAEGPKATVVITPDGDVSYMDAFVGRSVPSLIWGADNQNRLCSPVSAYMELSLLSEITGGETRAQALALLGAEDIETVRDRADTLYSRIYADTSGGMCLPANSLWLDERVSYNEDTLKTLARSYHASSFSGKMKNAAYRKALNAWIKKNTDGILKDGASNPSFNEGMAAVMISTLYFDDEWTQKFDKADTGPGVFHAQGGDVSCDFMKNWYYSGTYYELAQFTAISQKYKNGCTMWYILPREGITPESLLADAQLKDFLTPRKQGYEHREAGVVLRVPKFDVTYCSDLKRSLPELGVGLAFSPEYADYSPLGAAAGTTIDNIQSEIRIAIDENGVLTDSAKAAEASQASVDGDFTLNRPFMFLISSPDDLPLFVGIINDPTR